MVDSQTSFWTPARSAVVIGAVLLIVALAYLVSLPQNQFQPADLLEPKYAATRISGTGWSTNTIRRSTSTTCSW